MLKSQSFKVAPIPVYLSGCLYCFYQCLQQHEGQKDEPKQNIIKYHIEWKDEQNALTGRISSELWW